MKERVAKALRQLELTSEAEDGLEDPVISVSEDWAAELVVRFSLRFGRRFSTHTLRRTFGRNLWLRGIPIETIAELMGHSSTDTTRLYLGLNISDMRKAISEYGTKSELKILEKVPKRRISPMRERDSKDPQGPSTAREDAPAIEETPLEALSGSSAASVPRGSIAGPLFRDPHG